MSGPLDPLNKHLKALQARIAACEAKLGIEAPAGGGAGGADDDEVEPSEAQIEFGTFMKESIAPFVATGNEIGDVAAKLAGLVQRAANENASFLDKANRCKKPAMTKLQELIKPISEICKEAGAMNDRSSPFANHIKFVSEGLPAFSWVIIDSMPHTAVQGYLEAGEFYANKVRVEFKSKDARHVTFCNQFKSALTNLTAFVKKHFKTGLAWNPRGKDVDAAGGAAPAAAATATTGGAGGGAAARPNPMGGGGGGGGAGGGGGGMSALFGELKKIDQSGGKTAGLRHVTKDMKSSSAGGTVKAAPAPKAGGFKRQETKPKGPPSVKLIQKRWLIENQGAGDPVTIEEGVDKEKEIYISGCVGATIIIPKKAKAMTIDGCTKTQVVFESLLSSLEVVNCKQVKVQAKGSCKAVAIDKTDGITVYLSWESRDAQIVTSKSSEMNVSFPDSEADDADWSEMPIPEQFVSRIKGGKLVSEVSDLYSG